MLFNSLDFLIFFPIVLFIYFVIPRKVRYIWLLVTSYYFYMCWNASYALLLLASTVITYVSALLIGQWKAKVRLKKCMVGISLILNLGILFLYKYFNFAAYTLARLLEKTGVAFEIPTLDLLLPVGISFYIFQAVGYTIDVYRKKLEPEKNILRYALFVSFFPQLVAGPIERSTNLLSQLRQMDKLHLWETKRIQRGAVVMLYGYVLKMIIADRIAILVDTVFDPIHYGNYQGVLVAVAAALFSVQIYCDFAGYTYIAIGAARVMGFELMNNFNMPYLAGSIKEFWDRWHISLSTWFRDYLYFPLGGSRKGTVRKYINIFIVFLVSGLWHGASWHYVAWGLLHGIMRICGEITNHLREKCYVILNCKRDTLAIKLWKIMCTFSLVTVAWIFFRAESVNQSLYMVKSIFTVYNPWVLTDGTLFTLGLDAKEWNVLFVSILFLVLTDVLRYKNIKLIDLFMKQNLWFRWLFFYVGIMAVVIFGVYGAQYDAAQFIYFQF